MHAYQFITFCGFCSGMFDSTLLDSMKKLADKERAEKEERRKIKVKGRLVKVLVTKSNNILITVRRGEEVFAFLALRRNNAMFSLAERLPLQSMVYAEGVPTFRSTICTKFEAVNEGDSKQVRLLQ